MQHGRPCFLVRITIIECLDDLTEWNRGSGLRQTSANLAQTIRYCCFPWTSLRRKSTSRISNQLEFPFIKHGLKSSKPGSQNMLRVGYYAALGGTISEMEQIHDHNKRPDPNHLRHCFDYLRQSLVCAADSNLESVDFELGGVTGWSFQRTCRNFDHIKDWAEQWRSWDAASMKSEERALPSWRTN